MSVDLKMADVIVTLPNNSIGGFILLLKFISTTLNKDLIVGIAKTSFNF